MPKRKLQKFAALHTFTNVLQHTHYKNPALHNSVNEEVNYKGIWSADFFRNDNPLILELACGKGEYTIDMAKAMPDKNFIGIDIKGNRIHTGAKLGMEQQIRNAAFIRMEITQLPLFFAANEVSEIWITFPDPHLKPCKDQQRLTSERFLNIYKHFLQPGGLIHLKTDDPTLYNFTLETIADTNAILLFNDDDIYSKPLHHPFLTIKTYYEKMHLAEGKKIKYVQMKLISRFSD
ncbi:MAG: tRNA (guanosine(46)-N7)-methyltransferase TrmB [Chitinophagales bacterium]|nr:tRNA (guanosine(46)-N7)-methyltransferase TrmB [Chitinophagales bacterium]MBP9548959.1 tRNA (guanosine(46)-N7)-methyltransferase TrmB [Chitinophagales bacterium]MBP9705810.1 tRNA (guanosine(46)-N7)-methyltransferase TrmB [Chitinophagales bacterium]